MKIARFSMVVLCLLAGPADAGETSRRVDLMLVLAIDASASTAGGDFETQIGGHVSALRDSRVLRAVREGPLKRIGVSAIVWSDDAIQRRCADWAVLDDVAAAIRIGEAIERNCGFIGGTTAIGGAIRNAANQFRWSTLVSERWVIDLSANEPANEGLIAPYRRTALEMGIVINGLVLEPGDAAPASAARFSSLMAYFRSRVIGGQGAFAMTATRAGYREALVRKLVREIRNRRESS